VVKYNVEFGHPSTSLFAPVGVVSVNFEPVAVEVSARATLSISSSIYWTDDPWIESNAA